MGNKCRETSEDKQPGTTSQSDSHPPSFCVAGVALMALGWLWWHSVARLGALGRAWSLVTPLNFAWQAWHLATSSLVLRGRRGTGRHLSSFRVASVALMASGWLWWRAWARLVAGDAAQLCVACVALGDKNLRFAWQAWHLATSIFVLRGKRGTWRHLPWFGMAGVALGDSM